MEYKNLRRAAEIAQQLPPLMKARSILSKEKCKLTLTGIADKEYEETVELPRSVVPNILAALNKDIKELKSEVEGL